MENLPVDVRVVLDGQEAIDFIAKAGSEPDAPCPHFLLLDLNLPKVDGFGVLRRLRASERLKAIPVLVITSSDSPDDRRRAAELGAGYFRKTPSYEDFLKLGGVLKQLPQRQWLALSDFPKAGAGLGGNRAVNIDPGVDSPQDRRSPAFIGG
jgi:CheY-like chemotaxis protein